MRRLIILIILILSGCMPKVEVEVMSERTSLENQILGTYNSLDREMLLVASVRGVDSTGKIKKPPKHSQEHKDAISAMQVQSFHADDLQSFKTLGWVGEDNKGLVKIFLMVKENLPPDLKDFAQRYKTEEFHSVVKQINNSRKIIMQRVIDMNENLKDSDLEKVMKIFGKLNAENALKGEKIQKEDGSWITKK